VRVLRRGTTYKEVARCMRNVTQVSRANLDTTFFADRTLRSVSGETRRYRINTISFRIQ